MKYLPLLLSLIVGFCIISSFRDSGQDKDISNINKRIDNLEQQLGVK